MSNVAKSENYVSDTVQDGIEKKYRSEILGRRIVQSKESHESRMERD